MSYVLIIESDEERASALSEVCRGMGLAVQVSPDPLHGLMRAICDVPLTILINESSAWSWSSSVVNRIRRHERLASIPLVVVAGPTGRRSRRGSAPATTAFFRGRAWSFTE